MGIIKSNLPPVADTMFEIASENLLGVYCVSCKPGYKPYYSNLKDTHHHVYDCR